MESPYKKADKPLDSVDLSNIRGRLIQPTLYDDFTGIIMIAVFMYMFLCSSDITS